MANPQHGTIKSDTHQSLDEAMKDAHEKVAAAGNAGEWHRMRVFVKGDNPIRDYIVTLQRGNP